jgi:hypothetical protein
MHSIHTSTQVVGQIKVQHNTNGRKRNTVTETHHISKTHSKGPSPTYSKNISISLAITHTFKNISN